MNRQSNRHIVVKYISFVLLLLLVTTSAFAQNTGEIAPISMSQSTGSTVGGDVIILSFPWKTPICDPMCPDLTAFFGEAPARVTLSYGSPIQHGFLRVITPARVAGDAVVTVKFGDMVVARGATPFRFREPAVPYIELQRYETVLVPLAVGSSEPVPGAYGSLWKTEMWVTNQSPFDVELFRGDLKCATDVRSDCENRPLPVIPARASRPITFAADTTSAGYLFLVQKGGAEFIHFSLRVRDVSRSTQNAGTELPVVRMSTGLPFSATIVNVPVEDVSRTSLRIYSATNFDPQVRLKVIELNDDRLVVDDIVTLKPAGPNTPYTHRSRSGYAQIDDIRAKYPSLQPGRYRIEISSIPEGLAIPLFALASVTNNETQLIAALSSHTVQPYGIIRY